MAVRWGCYLLGGGKVCGCEMGLLPAGRGKSVAVGWGCYLLGGERVWLWDGVVTCWEGKECGCGMGLLVVHVWVFFLNASAIILQLGWVRYVAG